MVTLLPLPDVVYECSAVGLPELPEYSLGVAKSAGLEQLSGK